MPIETICSGCGKRLSVPDMHAGKQARCPVCSQIYTVPYPSDSSDSSAGANVGERVTDDLRGEGNRTESTLGDKGTPGGGSATKSTAWWLLSPDGNVYGPADQRTLERWFEEGRIGADFKIRQGERGAWRDSEAYRPAAAGDVNPYAVARPTATTPAVYAKSDAGMLIVIMGILGFIVCPLFSVAAWVMGAGALRDIQHGRMDPSGKGLVQAGYFLGIINCIFTLVWMLTVLMIVVTAVVGNLG